jgi:acyl-CoA thioesterase FadM
MKKNHFEFPLQLRYPDFDTQVFVNHAKISTFVESTYISFLIYELKTGWNFSYMPILLKNSQTEYFNPITYQASPVCVLNVIEVRRKGFSISVEIRDSKIEGVIYAKGLRTLIHVNLKTVTPVEWPNDIFEKLSSYLKRE